MNNPLAALPPARERRPLIGPSRPDMIEIPGVEGCSRPGRTTRTTEDLNQSHLIRPPHPEKTPCCPAPLCCCSSASAPPPASRCCRRQLLPAGHDSPPTARVSPGSVLDRFKSLVYCSESGLHENLSLFLIVSSCGLVECN